MANLDDCGHVYHHRGNTFSRKLALAQFFSLQASGSKFFRRRNIAYHRPSWLILCECNTNISENIQFGLYGPGKRQLGVGGFFNRTVTRKDD
jgi:hypothetical protein